MIDVATKSLFSAVTFRLRFPSSAVNKTPLFPCFAPSLGFWDSPFPSFTLPSFILLSLLFSFYSFSLQRAVFDGFHVIFCGSGQVL
ncbi:hypothetical protein P8452_38715 [Trifolium repens]|nr:hypothetical protein P8452_38715 [Trifolium repens]